MILCSPSSSLEKTDTENGLVTIFTNRNDSGVRSWGVLRPGSGVAAVKGQHCIAVMQSQQLGTFKVCAGTRGVMLQHALGYCCDSLPDQHGCPVHQSGRSTLSPCCCSSQLFWCWLSSQSPLWEPVPVLQCAGALVCLPDWFVIP